MRSSPSPDAATMQPHNIDDEFIRGAYGLAEFWSGQDKRITHAIRSLPSDEKIAIYGAGFYGTYLLGLANKCNRDITCFIDSNPHLIGGDSCGLNVISPTELPSIVKTILVGLNPSRAKEIIKDIDAFKGAEVSFIYIE